MNILIQESTRSDDTHFLAATCDTTSASVIVYDDGEVRVTCQNASHRVWRGAGRGFRSVEAALEGYKSSAMKAIIQTAADEAKRSRAGAAPAEGSA